MAGKTATPADFWWHRPHCQNSGSSPTVIACTGMTLLAPIRERRRACVQGQQHGRPGQTRRPYQDDFRMQYTRPGANWPSQPNAIPPLTEEPSASRSASPCWPRSPGAGAPSRLRGVRVSSGRCSRRSCLSGASSPTPSGRCTGSLGIPRSACARSPPRAAITGRSALTESSPIQPTSARCSRKARWTRPLPPQMNLGVQETTVRAGRSVRSSHLLGGRERRQLRSKRVRHDATSAP
jgi:hypothetical protein